MIAAWLAWLPGIVLSAIAPLLAREVAVMIARRVLVVAARTAARLTRTTVDDEIVEELAKRLGAAQDTEQPRGKDG